MILSILCRSVTHRRGFCIGDNLCVCIMPLLASGFSSSDGPLDEIPEPTWSIKDLQLSSSCTNSLSMEELGETGTKVVTGCFKTGRSGCSQKGLEQHVALPWAGSRYQSTGTFRWGGVRYPSWRDGGSLEEFHKWCLGEKEPRRSKASMGDVAPNQDHSEGCSLVLFCSDKARRRSRVTHLSYPWCFLRVILFRSEPNDCILKSLAQIQASYIDATAQEHLFSFVQFPCGDDLYDSASWRYDGDIPSTLLYALTLLALSCRWVNDHELLEPGSLGKMDLISACRPIFDWTKYSYAEWKNRYTWTINPAPAVFYLATFDFWIGADMPDGGTTWTDVRMVLGLSSLEMFTKSISNVPNSLTKPACVTDTKGLCSVCKYRR